MSLVKGIHHVSMQCCDQQEYEKAVQFYRDVLGMKIVRSWAEGVMLDTGCGIIEIFSNGVERLDKGTIRHFALAADDTDECIKAIRNAGYEVFVEPKDIEIPSEPGYPARIAFCRGPLGEEIEFFQAIE